MEGIIDDDGNDDSLHATFCETDIELLKLSIVMMLAKRVNGLIDKILFFCFVFYYVCH